MTASASYDALKARYDAAGQGQVLDFWSKLSSSDQSALAAQLDALDVERVNRVYKRAIQAEKELSDPAVTSQAIEPLPEDATESVVQHPEVTADLRSKGVAAIAAGEVAVLLMAGGQGTRLGSSAPKGCYDIGLPSHKSLFQLQAERISSLQAVAEREHQKPQGSVIVPWYIMTSGPTRKDTENFFKSNSYFGLDQKNIVVFEQGTLPCLTEDGKILLDTQSHIAVAPDGNGGLYAAIRSPLTPQTTTTVLSDLQSRNIKYVHTYGVDNCLVRVADPVFLGFCIKKGADCAAKVVPKTDPSESVGVVARKGHKYTVVEYSEISKAQAEQRDASGALAFRAANIANHFYTTDFLRKVGEFEDQLAFHIARKKIPHVDSSSGEVVKPTKPNGMKLELFVFDVFPHTEHFAALEVARQDEFSPLKNAPNTGSDDPQTSRRDLIAQHRRYLEAAGAKVAEGVEIELSPLVSYAGEGLETVKGKHFTKSGSVSAVEELDALA